MFRANAAGTATVAAAVPKKVQRVVAAASARRRPDRAGVRRAGASSSAGPTARCGPWTPPDGKILWQASSRAAVVHPPAYWNGRVVFGSCDGFLYCLDASDGRVLGRVELAPEKRLVNIMGRLMSAWPLGGGVVVGDDGIAYTAAGSTAADGAVVAAVDVATGQIPLAAGLHPGSERAETELRRPGKPPAEGQHALHQRRRPGGNRGPGRGDRRESSRGRPAARRAWRCSWSRTASHRASARSCTARAGQDDDFKRHQGRVYFQLPAGTSPWSTAACSARDRQALDRIVDLMNKDPKTGGRMGGGQCPGSAAGPHGRFDSLGGQDRGRVRPGRRRRRTGGPPPRQRGRHFRGRQVVVDGPAAPPPGAVGRGADRQECVVTLTDGRWCAWPT